VSVLIPHGKELPLTGQSDQFHTKGGVPERHPLKAPIYEGHMPEGEIPFGPSNTLLGELVVMCPSTSNLQGIIPLMVEYEVDESRKIRVKCWFRDDPSVAGEVALKCGSIARENTHIVERAERTVNEAGERVSPDEKARINRKRQALMDLSEQYMATPDESVRKQIIETSDELKSMVKAIEQKLGLK
jgi:hypothetical protein